MLKPRNRLRAMYQEARIASGRPDNAPAVVHATLKVFRDYMLADTDLVDMLVADDLQKD